MSKKNKKTHHSDSIKPELGREIATTGDGQDITQPWVGALALPSDSVLRNRGGSDLKIYEEVLTDEEVKSSFTQRQDAVTSREYKVEAGGNRPVDIAAADFIREQINQIGYDRITKLMHFGVFYGYAVSEIIYGKDSRHFVWDNIKVRNRRRFRYAPDGELRLLTRDNQSDGIPCPSPYFWHYATGADHDDEPYGLGLAHWLYWPTLFKRNGVKFWLIFLDKFGMPTTIGRYDTGATEDQKRKLLQTTRAIQTDSGVILPQGMTLELLGAARSGAADYESLYNAMNNAIRRVVVGQTASSGGTPGKLGNDDLQGDVLKSIAKSDADLIDESFTRGPVTTLVELNYPGAAIPRVSRVFDEPEDLTSRSTRDKNVSEFTGYRPTLASIKETYGGEWEPVPNTAAPVVEQKPAKADNVEFAEQSELASVPSAMLEQARTGVEPATDNWINQVRDLAHNVESLEELRDGLDKLLPNMTLDEYAEAMAQALTAAELAGRYEIVQEMNNGR